MKTAVIYARYSSSNQTEQSIEGQIHVCEDYAKRNNIIIVDSYIDRAISGTTDERDAFQRMLKDSNNKKWNYVLVYKLDRFARNKYESAIHKKHLKDNGITLLSAMENIPETPEGILLESLLEGMNEYFSKELAQKVSRGLHESRMKGRFVGVVGYGYTRIDKKLVINEKEAIILRRIFEDYASGKTILQISRDLANDNITINGRNFPTSTIRAILQRKAYTGIYELNGKTYNNVYPPIISLELFEKVQQRLNLTRYGCRKDNHEIYRLRNKIYCGYCNKKMYPSSTKSRNGKPLKYYKCDTPKKDNCLTKIAYKDFIEGLVDKFFKLQFCIPKNLETITNLIYEANIKRNKENTSVSNLKSNLQKVSTSISNIMTAIEKGIFTETTKSRLEELEKQRKDLQEQLVIQESKISYELTKEEIQNFFKYTMKECPEKAIDLFLKFVKVYEDKIEIGLNYSINQTNTDYTPIKTYLFTESLIKYRAYKGKIASSKTITYDIYSVI